MESNFEKLSLNLYNKGDQVIIYTSNKSGTTNYIDIATIARTPKECHGTLVLVDIFEAEDLLYKHELDIEKIKNKIKNGITPHKQFYIIKNINRIEKTILNKETFINEKLRGKLLENKIETSDIYKINEQEETNTEAPDDEEETIFLKTPLLIEQEETTTEAPDNEEETIFLRPPNNEQEETTTESPNNDDLYINDDQRTALNSEAFYIRLNKRDDLYNDSEQIKQFRERVPEYQKDTLYINKPYYNVEDNFRRFIKIIIDKVITPLEYNGRYNTNLNEPFNDTFLYIYTKGRKRKEGEILKIYTPQNPTEIKKMKDIKYIFDLLNIKINIK